jgi:glyoxylase-like metal-dependent hydrolase (beta-lactamase superfamily II)
VKRFRVACIAGLWAASLPALAQQDFSNVQIEAVPVAEDVYMLVGEGGNIGLSIGEDGTFIIDDQYAQLSDKIQAAAREVGGGDIEYVINTHWHGDHTGGNANFANGGAVIVAHNNVRERLAGDGADAAALPVVTFPDRISFHWNGDDLNLIHAPFAHTDGDVIIHFTNLNVFHMGDVFNNSGYPYIDLGSEGSFDGIITASESVLARANSETRIIPGHGPLADRDDLENYVNVLKTIRSRFQSLIDEGRSEDQVVAAGVTSEWDETWGAGFMNPEQFTRLAYQSLTSR